MPKLPAPTPKKVLSRLKKSGFYVDHVTGSHCVLYHPISKKEGYRSLAQTRRAEGHSSCYQKISWFIEGRLRSRKLNESSRIGVAINIHDSSFIIHSLCTSGPNGHFG